jgi:hypothetical protein
MYVLYHGGCYDGWTAAWIAERSMPGAILLPAFHGQPIPDTPVGSDVYMIDIAFPNAEMVAYSRDRQLRVLDHHKSREVDMAGLNYVFDVTQSGAMLAWHEFHDTFHQAPPHLVRYTQDRDLWQFKLPQAAEIGCYIESFPRDLDTYDTLSQELETNLAQCADIGRELLRYKQTRVHEIADLACEIDLCSYRVPIVNTSCLMSEVAHELGLRFPRACFTAYYFRRPDGLNAVGLRTMDPVFDVSLIATRFQGGGGHRAAAGFQITDNEMSALLNR